MAGSQLQFPNPSLAEAASNPKHRRKTKRKKGGRNMAAKNRRRARDSKGRFKKGPRRGRKKTAKRKTKRKSKRNPTGVVVRTTAEGVNVTRNRRGGKKQSNRRRTRDSKGRFKKGRGGRRNPATRKSSANPANPTVLERLQEAPMFLAKLSLPLLGSAVLFRVDERFSNRAVELLRIKGTTDRDGRTVAPMDTVLGKGVRGLTALALGLGVDFILPGVKKMEMSAGNLVSFALLAKLAAEILQDNVEPLIPALKEKPPAALPSPEPTGPIGIELEPAGVSGSRSRGNGRRSGVGAAPRPGLGAVGRMGVPVQLPGPRF